MGYSIWVYMEAVVAQQWSTAVEHIPFVGIPQCVVGLLSIIRRGSSIKSLKDSAWGEKVPIGMELVQICNKSAL